LNSALALGKIAVPDFALAQFGWVIKVGADDRAKEIDSQL
jgi:hypothetical protein